MIWSSNSGVRWNTGLVCGIGGGNNPAGGNGGGSATGGFGGPGKPNTGRGIKAPAVPAGGAEEPGGTIFGGTVPGRAGKPPGIAPAGINAVEPPSNDTR